jgi:hypothetical protein
LNNKVEKDEMGGSCSTNGEKRNAYRLLVGNIRMDLGEVEWGDEDWIGLAQDRSRWRALVNSVVNLRVP